MGFEKVNRQHENEQRGNWQLNSGRPAGSGLPTKITRCKTTKISGERCKAAPMSGAAHCTFHGGADAPD